MCLSEEAVDWLLIRRSRPLFYLFYNRTRYLQHSSLMVEDCKHALRSLEDSSSRCGYQIPLLESDFYGLECENYKKYTLNVRIYKITQSRWDNFLKSYHQKTRLAKLKRFFLKGRDNYIKNQHIISLNYMKRSSPQSSPLLLTVAI